MHGRFPGGVVDEIEVLAGGAHPIHQGIKLLARRDKASREAHDPVGCQPALRAISAVRLST